eukprot:m.162330 g.162330  ORF g.162330 m.162330 type:complete len:384 (+) comp12177_c0_seq1:1463-2614(+)
MGVNPQASSMTKGTCVVADPRWSLQKVDTHITRCTNHEQPYQTASQTDNRTKTDACLLGEVLGRLEPELGGPCRFHHRVKDTKLERSERANHDTASTQTRRAQLVEANLTRKASQTNHDGAIATGAGLVDLGQQRVGWVRDDGRGHTGNGTRGERHTQVVAGRRRGRLGARRTVNEVGCPSLDRKLGHCVWNLLEQNGAKARVEATNDTFLLGQTCRATHKPVGKLWIRDQTDTRGLEWAQENVSDKLSAGRGSEVDWRLELPSTLLAKVLNRVDFDNLDTAKLEPALDKVAHNRWSKTRCQGTHAFGRNDLTESANHSLVVDFGLKLDACLDDINRAQSAVRNRAADTAGKSTLEVVCQVVRGKVGGGSRRVGPLHDRRSRV